MEIATRDDVVKAYLRLLRRPPESEEVVSGWVQQRLTRRELISHFKKQPEADQVRFLRWLIFVPALSYFAMSIIVMMGHSMMVGPLPDITTLEFWTLALLGPLAFLALAALCFICLGSILFLVLNAIDPTRS